MPDKPFVINDRRRFTADGELRPEAATHDAHHEPKPEPAPRAPEPAAAEAGPRLVAMDAKDSASEASEMDESGYPPPPTAEQTAQAARAYAATVDRLDTAIRAQNLGAEHAPLMTFERLVQSLYMQAILQLGGAAAPGQQPQLDLLGARNTIDMLGIIEDKSKGNLADSEAKLVDAALFEMRMAFLEVTQALAQQAAQRAQPAADPSHTPTGGPSIIR